MLKIYDATLFSNSDMSLPKAHCFYEWAYYRSELGRELPSDERIQEVVSTAREIYASGDLGMIIDIESWAMPGDPYASESERKQGYAKMLELVKKTNKLLKPNRILNYARQLLKKPVSKSISLGIYSYLPSNRYWQYILPNTLPGLDWVKTQNDSCRELIDAVDFVCTSPYFYYDMTQEKNVTDYLKYLDEYHKEARRITKKPIYAFIWPKYSVNRNSLLGDKFVPDTIWELTLNKLNQIHKQGNLNGIIIWGGYDMRSSRAYPWDSAEGKNSSWWRILNDFSEKVKNEGANQ